MEPLEGHHCGSPLEEPTEGPTLGDAYSGLYLGDHSGGQFGTTPGYTACRTHSGGKILGNPV